MGNNGGYMFRSVALTFMLFLTGSVIPVQSKIYDPYWMFSDNNELLYNEFSICDTCRTREFNCKSLEAEEIPDTGKTYNNTKYICFDYKFSSDSFFVYDEFDKELVIYKGRRPGYAGFKAYWEGGMLGFFIARYNNLIFAHKGPNLNHKVTVGARYNNGECGSPSYYETIGTFNSSLEWKLDTLPIPEKIRVKNDTLRNQSQYYELLFLITNINSSDTTSGAPGCLKIDDIKLTGYNPIDTSPKSQAVIAGNKVTFKVGISKDISLKEAISFQWKKNGISITGAKNPEYVIIAATPVDSGVYTVDVCIGSSGNTFTSWGATLKVNSSASVIPRTKNEQSKGSEAVLNDTDDKKCGCGSGAGLALLPPLWFKIRNRKKNKSLHKK
jgi:hypothetical protein